MRKVFVALSLVAGISLGGCATGPNGKPTIDPAQITAIEGQVQQTAAAICGFVPTVGTVASVIATFTGGGAVVDIVNTVAKSICNAVVPAKSAKRKAALPQVNGVVIQGYFIR